MTDLPKYYYQSDPTHCGCGRRVLVTTHPAPRGMRPHVRTECIGCGREVQLMALPIDVVGCTCPLLVKPPHQAVSQ